MKEKDAKNNGEETLGGIISNPFMAIKPGWHSQQMRLAKASDYVSLEPNEDFACLVSAPHSKGCVLIDYVMAAADEAEELQGNSDETIGALALETVPVPTMFHAWPGCTKETCRSQILQYFPNIKQKDLESAVSEAMGDYEAFWHEEESLPIEFFLHQVYDLNTTDNDAIVKFVSEWGIPASPLRIADVSPTDYYKYEGVIDPYGPDPEFDPAVATFGDLLRANESGIEETDQLQTKLRDEMDVWDPDDKNSPKPGSLKKPNWTPWGPVVSISLLEARASLDLIKHCVGWYQGILELENETNCNTTRSETMWSNNAESRFILQLINTIPKRTSIIRQNVMESPRDYAPFTFDNDGPGYDMCGFVRAIMRQLADTLANESVPWKKCKGRNCGKYFKYQQPKKPSKGTPHSDAIYCSRWCADNNAHAMKDKRERNQGCASGS